jgi:hypothetical protein
MAERRRPMRHGPRFGDKPKNFKGSLKKLLAYIINFPQTGTKPLRIFEGF